MFRFMNLVKALNKRNVSQNNCRIWQWVYRRKLMSYVISGQLFWLESHF